MEATIHNILEAIQNFAVHSNPLIGIMLGVGLIILESMIPVLPLALFIAMNTILFGNFWGFIISWVSTICGCMLSFYIFRKGISSFLYKKLPEDGHILQFMRRITEIPFEVNKFDDCNNQRNKYNNRVTVPPFKLRHIGKVHSVPSRD